MVEASRYEVIIEMSRLKVFQSNNGIYCGVEAENDAEGSDSERYAEEQALLTREKAAILENSNLDDHVSNGLVFSE